MALRAGDPCPVCSCRTPERVGAFCAACQGTGIYDPHGPAVRVVQFSPQTLKIGKSLQPCQRSETTTPPKDRRYSRRKWLPVQLRAALEAPTYADYCTAILAAGQQPYSRISWTCCRKAARGKGLRVQQSTMGRHAIRH